MPLAPELPGRARIRNLSSVMVMVTVLVVARVQDYTTYPCSRWNLSYCCQSERVTEPSPSIYASIQVSFTMSSWNTCGERRRHLLVRQHFVQDSAAVRTLKDGVLYVVGSTFYRHFVPLVFACLRITQTSCMVAFDRPCIRQG